jgi:hypothetical protein
VAAGGGEIGPKIVGLGEHVVHSMRL